MVMMAAPGCGLKLGDGKEFVLYVIRFECNAARHMGDVNEYFPLDPIKPGTPVPTEYL